MGGGKFTAAFAGLRSAKAYRGKRVCSTRGHTGETGCFPRGSERGGEAAASVVIAILGGFAGYYQDSRGLKLIASLAEGCQFLLQLRASRSRLLCLFGFNGNCLRCRSWLNGLA